MMVSSEVQTTHKCAVPFNLSDFEPQQKTFLVEGEVKKPRGAKANKLVKSDIKGPLNNFCVRICLFGSLTTFPSLRWVHNPPIHLLNRIYHHHIATL